MKQLPDPMYLLVICMTLYPFVGNGQKVGIKFEENLSWQQVLAKAKVENKTIFMDCYTTWCGPCKFMSKEIFSQGQVGEYFDSHFINVAVQMDKTSKDSPDIQKWYKDAKDIEKKYSVLTYPTYLFFSPNGKPIHQFVGASRTGEEFISKASNALDIDKQYFTLIENWDKNKEDSAYLLHTLTSARDAGDIDNEKVVANYYINCLKDPATLSNIQLLNPLIKAEGDWAFQFYLKNAISIDQLTNKKDFTIQTLTPIIFKEEVAPLLLRKNTPINWKEISNNLQQKYGVLDKYVFSNILDGWLENAIGGEINEAIGKMNVQPKTWGKTLKKLKYRFPGYECEKILLEKEIQYYMNEESWIKCSNISLSYLNKYSSQVGSFTINNICFDIIFLHSSEKKILSGALRHMENLLKNDPEDIDEIDTYANLLYKTGHRQRAIILENKSIGIAQKKDINDNDLKVALKKMQKGEPTWKIHAPGS